MFSELSLGQSLLNVVRLPCGLKRYMRCGSWLRKYPFHREYMYTDVIPEPVHTSSSNEGITLYDLFSYCVPWQGTECGLIMSTFVWFRSQLFGFVSFYPIERYMKCGSWRRKYPFQTRQITLDWVGQSEIWCVISPTERWDRMSTNQFGSQNLHQLKGFHCMILLAALPHWLIDSFIVLNSEPSRPNQTKPTWST